MSVAEGGNLVFTVTLSAAVEERGLTVAYTTNNGTATTGDGDYTDNDGSLTFTGTAGETQTITVVTGTDTKVEADETLSVLLGAITAATATQSAAISTSGSPATGTIINNDTATLSIGNVSVAEGGNLVFTVTLSAAVQDGLTVAYTTNNGTATTGDGDYTDNDGSLRLR